VQTHLFEDRVMKMDRIDIGSGCSVGTDSVVLYGSCMEPGSVLGDLSLLMKGETLAQGTRWEGSPARPSRPMPSPAAQPSLPPAVHQNQVRLILEPCTTPGDRFTELEGNLVLLGPDTHGRPRARDAEGRILAVSTARATGVRILAVAPSGRIGVDLEPMRPSQALKAASELFLPSERAWTDSLPEPAQWRTLLALWTVKEAMLKALGQGFSFGMDQIELGPDGEGGIRLQRLSGSERLARGWSIHLDERDVQGRTYLVALAMSATPSAQ
jgi:phosphopantetheinyl transferase (holo-ACP synthase)